MGDDQTVLRVISGEFFDAIVARDMGFAQRFSRISGLRPACVKDLREPPRPLVGRVGRRPQAAGNGRGGPRKLATGPDLEEGLERVRPRGCAATVARGSQRR